jgi:hypothetical protein
MSLDDELTSVMPESRSIKVDLGELSGMEPPQLQLTIWLERLLGSATERAVTHPVMVEYFDRLLDVVILTWYSSWHGIYQRNNQVHGRFMRSLRALYLGCHMVLRKCYWELITCKDTHNS